jgi:hypothetical protein
MSADTSAFYRDVAKNHRLWTARRDGTYAAATTRAGNAVQPFWSSLGRIQRIIKNVRPYARSEAVELSWTDFRDHWLPRFRAQGILVGVNWSGADASGYDLEPDWVHHCVEVEIENLGGPPATPIEKVVKDGLVVGYRLVPRP